MKESFDWNDFNKARKNSPPRDTLVLALKKFSTEKQKNRNAFDIGCGPGNDTAELLSKGWKVTATDKNHGILPYIEPLRQKYDGMLEIQIASFEDIKWKKTDLVNASFTLPFCPQKHFKELWKNISDNIKPGGRFSGQFFGKKDEWKELVRHTRKEVIDMLNGFYIEMIGEVEKDDTTAVGVMKHWHIFNIVARKK